MQKWSKHILLWLSYILFKVLLNISSEQVIQWESFVSVFFIQLSYLPIKVPLVYASLFGLELYFTRKLHLYSVLILEFALLSGASVLMSLVHHLIVLPFLLSVESSYSVLHVGSLIYHMFQLLFVVGMASALKLAGRQYDATLAQITLQKEKTENELKYLKSQINPHFLFNTLNNIYSLARKGSEHTADSIMKLSQLMRYTLHETSHAQISIQEEVNIIETYIELEKLRYSNRLRVQFQTEIDNPSKGIAPLLLMHFVENAFKHGASESGSEVKVSVLISLKNHELKAQIRNTINRLSSPSDLKIGMENTKRQLQLLYPTHRLEISSTAHEFYIDLTLSL